MTTTPTRQDDEFEQHRAEFHQRRRCGYITGIREYATWLEAHPDVAIPDEERLLRPVHTNDALATFAAALDLTEQITVDEEGNASVTIPFGGGVSLHVYGYRDHAASADRIDARTAHTYATRHHLRLVADRGPEGRAA
jgi:hypothetical protein